MSDDVVQKNADAYDAQAGAWEAQMSTNIGHKYLEKPAMRSLLPQSFAGKSVLCVGVGSGDELADIVARNPERVVGIDISEKLLEIAHKKYPTAECKTMDMHQTSFVNAEFDFIFSSLTFHYSSDWDALLAEMKRILKPDGQLLFSSHNPAYWGRKPATGRTVTNARGVLVTEHVFNLLGMVPITYYNHTSVEGITGALTHAGFTVEQLVYPTIAPLSADASTSERADYEESAAKNAAIPYFLVIKAAVIR
jgi:ubiquinone/menaquinone biosynthesis C-methylase UbiE